MGVVIILGAIAAKGINFMVDNSFSACFLLLCVQVHHYAGYWLLQRVNICLKTQGSERESSHPGLLFGIDYANAAKSITAKDKNKKPVE